MLPDADEYLLSIRDMISKIDLHRSSRVMFEAADKVIHENVNYPRPILRAIGLRYLLSRLSTETYSPQLREGLQITISQKLRPSNLAYLIQENKSTISLKTY